eukprot:TRINITY_DN3618_c0_g1_i1.p1 TRINITY_DN3618_c0_g1~~TRINITY_DN3618_c0_g1_i1.p1  ORF type:complete len:491 (+),score=85.14 TRINITY_DN3618_c0_g1_i1:57-1529(+)
MPSDTEPPPTRGGQHQHPSCHVSLKAVIAFMFLASTALAGGTAYKVAVQSSQFTDTTNMVDLEETIKKEKAIINELLGAKTARPEKKNLQMLIHDDGGDPPRATNMVTEFTDVCLPARGGDRFENPVPWDRKKKLEKGWGDLGDGPAFVVLDLCKMGHQPKDATLLHAVNQERKNKTPIVLFGNKCMSRAKTSKGTWHVLKDWFDVSIGIEETEEKSRIVYIEDHPKGVCVRKLQRRPHHEPFRWLRTARQADMFRTDFLKHFKIPPTVRFKVGITVLRRGIERHFDEDVVNGYVQAWDPERFSVRYVQFDNDNNPRNTGVEVERVLKYKDQLAVLASTDILLAGHGAAFSSIVVLPSGSAAVEAFPHNFRYHMYAELALLFSVNYFPIESLVPWKNNRSGCSSCPTNDLLAVSQPYHANGLKNCKSCTPPCKKCDIKLDWERKWVPVLRTALYTVQNSILGSFRRQLPVTEWEKKYSEMVREEDDWEDD